MEDKIHKVQFENEFRVCPECGYADGFHTMIKKETDTVKWLFICPACHKIFDIGYTVDLLKTGPGNPYPEK
ncbi:P-loop NTPase family protein [Desulforapulum autotrophicum]|uniref:hypothetical protein n=1 Tax=Desulforapulum autotrophicum TaxID=2296 RepID=UPI0002F77708|nr:hypothetical protein [Desulforapulum autotrophicum]